MKLEQEILSSSFATRFSSIYALRASKFFLYFFSASNAAIILSDPP
jgi:hypothetical protein